MIGRIERPCVGLFGDPELKVGEFEVYDMRVVSLILATQHAKPVLFQLPYCCGNVACFLSGLLVMWRTYTDRNELLCLTAALYLQAFREEGAKQPLYRVRFQQTDVWELYQGARQLAGGMFCCSILRSFLLHKSACIDA